MPEGVSYEGVFGGSMRGLATAKAGAPQMLMNRRAAPLRGGFGGGGLGGLGGRALEEKRRDGEKAERDEPAAGEPQDAAAAKLDPKLRGLAEKVAEAGPRGTVTIEGIEVRDGRVEVRVHLASLSDEVIAKLEKLGFKELARAKSVHLVIGTIDVAKLEALAELEEVRRIEPSS
jgi:hypothetical protein